MSNLSGFVKRLRDIMRNDAGINGDAQRIEQIAWMLFLNLVYPYYNKIDSISEEGDQEVYKVVLGWYKQQIESGKMTLNQCYELLSDKAKVSLNKMVDQSKIKESMINKTNIMCLLLIIKSVNFFKLILPFFLV